MAGARETEQVHKAEGCRVRERLPIKHSAGILAAEPPIEQWRIWQQEPDAQHERALPLALPAPGTGRLMAPK